MIQNIKTFFSLFLSMIFIIIGSGLLGIYFPIMAQKSFSVEIIGIFVTIYFIGYLLGSLFTTRFLNVVGHVRTFTLSLALVSISLLIFILNNHYFAWGLSRLFLGFGMAGIYVIIESWVSAITLPHERGKAFATYRIIELSSIILGQNLLNNLTKWNDTQIIGLILLFTSISAIPISLSLIAQPQKNYPLKLSISELWGVSKFCTIIMFCIGMTNSTIWNLTPIFIKNSLQNELLIPKIFSFFVIGGILIQYPISILANRFDKRMVNLSLALLGIITAISLSNQSSQFSFILLFFVLGCASMPLYSLIINLAMDRCNQENIAKASSQLLFVFSLGAIIGPTVSGYLMKIFSNTGYTIHLIIGFSSIFTITLIQIIKTNPINKSKKFKYQLFPQGGLLFYLNRAIKRKKIDDKN